MRYSGTDSPILSTIRYIYQKMYYLCSMAKKTSTFDYEILVRYMLPKGILDTFEVAKVEEECTGVMDETNTEIRILQTLSFKLCR